MALINNALTTLDTVKVELGIESTDTSKDPQLERLINSVSDRVLKYIDRNLRKQTYTEKKQGNNRQILVLDNRPIVDVASVVLDSNTLDTDDYEIEDEEAGLLFKHDLWTTDEQLRRRSASADIVPHTSKYNITVIYEAGYVLPNDATVEEPRTLPYDLEDAVINIICSKYNQRQNKSDGIEKYTISDESITFAGTTISQDDMNILDRYKDVV